MSSTRTIQDFDLTVTTALPAQNTNADSASIDIEAIGPAALESVELEITLPATADLADGQTITLTIQDSADDTTFASVAELATLIVTGAGGTGAAAATRKVRLPSSTARYLNLNAAASATAGDNTAVSYTWKLLN